MENVPLDLLSPFGNREHATDLTRRATGLPAIAAHNLVLTVDASTTAVLRTAGLTIAEARPILAVLWQDPERISDTDPDRTATPLHRPGRQLAPGGGDRYLPDLGERLRVIREVRRLSRARVAGRAGLTVYGLDDLETGTAWPTLPLLLNLADILEVPIPVLVDPHATPLRILRLLAGQYAAA